MEKLFVCDGRVPDCERTYCHWEGKGSCSHTSDRAHARYRGAREWNRVQLVDGPVFVERIRDEGKELR